MKDRSQEKEANGVTQRKAFGASLEVLPSPQPPTAPHREAMIKMVRATLGPLLEDLQSAAKSAKDAQRLLEIAIWADDQGAAQAITHELARLAAAASAPASAPPPARGLAA
jgi:hypothetical protein